MTIPIKQLLNDRPDVKEKYYQSIPYPRYECPTCGNPISDITYKNISKDVVCNLCDTSKLEQFVFIERR